MPTSVASPGACGCTTVASSPARRLAWIAQRPSALSAPIPFPGVKRAGLAPSPLPATGAAATAPGSVVVAAGPIAAPPAAAAGLAHEPAIRGTPQVVVATVDALGE